MTRNSLSFAAYLAGAVLTLGAIALAANPKVDWGYDDQANGGMTYPPIEELKAAPAKALNAKPGAKQSSKPPRLKAEKDVKAVECWIKLFNLVAKEPLTGEQKERFRLALAHKLSTDRAHDVYSINSYWSEVEKRMNTNEEEKNAFAALFRSLLRFESRAKSVNEDDASILSELLGPERVAVPGDPPLTEDSVDAYGDMACFMYEQAHPGKSVDAVDNRTVFAHVICGKFRDAPTAADKKAMANFALTWSKFKVLYLISSGDERQLLLKQIQAGQPPHSGSEESNSLVSSIFMNGPWHTKSQ